MTEQADREPQTLSPEIAKLKQQFITVLFAPPDENSVFGGTLSSSKFMYITSSLSLSSFFMKLKIR